MTSHYHDAAIEDGAEKSEDRVYLYSCNTAFRRLYHLLMMAGFRSLDALAEACRLTKWEGNMPFKERWRWTNAACERLVGEDYHL